MSTAELLSNTERLQDTPTYWIGQVSAIAEMESRGKLSRDKAMKEVQDILKRMRVSQNRREMLLLRFADAFSKKEES